MPTTNDRYSYIEYTCDGSTTTFQIPFDYLEQDDITVFVDGVETTYTFTSSNTVEVTPAPVAGTIVRLRRNTDADLRAVDFRDGSVLTEADLDNSAIQIFNVAQEAMDLASDAVGVSEDGRIDGQNRQIKSVAAPTAPDHAVNLNFIQTEYGNVTDVKNNEANITTTANDIGNVNTVAANIADVNTVATDISNVNDVAGHIPTLNANYTNIDTVATNIADVSNLSGQIANINTVAASFATGATAPATPNVGDRWFDTTNNTLYLWDGANWYEAAVYSVARHFVFRNIGSALSSVSGTDSDGNTVYVPPAATLMVFVDGFSLVEGDDYTRSSTSLITFTNPVPTGSTIDIRAMNPMLTNEYTQFQTMQNAASAAQLAAEAAETGADNARTAAEAARDTAILEAADAATSEANALAYRDQANTYKQSSQTYASNSASSAQDSANSATAAAASALSAARQDMEDGSAATAGLGFAADTDTGLFRPAPNIIGFASAGAETMRVTNSGLNMATGKILDAPNRNRGLVQMVTWSNTQSKQEPTTSYADLRHSAVNFTPKFSDSTITYEFSFQNSYKDTHGIGHYRIYRNGSRQAVWDCTLGGDNMQGRFTLFYRTGSWGTSTQQIKIMFRDYGGSNEVWAHATQHWDGAGTDNDVASFGRVMEWRN